jgi:hypothetical protein
MAMMMTIAAELYVCRDRVKALEALLVERGVLAEGDVDNFEPSPEDRARLAAERDAFVEALLSQVKGVQVSQGVG